MIDNLLPIGSVVKVNGSEKRLMVFGVKQKTGEDEERVYDYVGVTYPEGNLGKEYHILFDEADIEEVVFRGFEDQERSFFLNELKKYYEPENAFDIPAEPLEEELEAEKLGAGELNLE